MSDEGRVMPSDMTQDAMPKQVNLFWVKGLSAHGGAEGKPSQGTDPGKMENELSLRTEE
jgi:hypothetical protein